VLSDKEQRKQYDMFGQTGGASAGTGSQGFHGESDIYFTNE